MRIHADTGKRAGQAPQIPVRPPVRLGGLRELLGLGKNRHEDLTPQVQMGIALARTKRQGETYAGTVSYAEKQRRRAFFALRYAGAETTLPVEPALPDDYPTTPIPVIPPAPAVPEMRLMLRRDELLWCKSGDDPDGVITLGLLPAPEGQLGVLMDDNGIAIGVRLDRHEVQGLRDAITGFLVASSKPVRP